MGLKQQLESAGYDTSSLNEADMIKKLDAAGYDTSKLNQTSMYDQVKAGVVNAVNMAKNQMPLADVTMRAAQAIQQAPDKAGLAVAEAGPQGGLRSPLDISGGNKTVSPEASGLLGGAIATAPDMLAAGEGIANAPAAGEAITNLLKQGMKRTLTGPATEGVLNTRQAMTMLPEEKAAKEAELLALKSARGKGIEQAEKGAGIGLNDTGLPTMPKDVKGFADTMQHVSNLDKNQLNQAMDLQGLQGLRKQAEMVLEDSSLPKTYRAVIERGRENIAQAIGDQVPEFKQALNAHRETVDAINSLPEEFAAKKASMQRALLGLRSEAHGEQTLRKAIGVTAGGGMMVEALRRLARAGH